MEITIFIILLIISVLFLILTFIWESMTFCALDMFMWWIIAINIPALEIPYQYVLPDGTVGEAMQVVEGLYPLMYLFVLIGILMMLYLMIDFVFPFLKAKFPRMM